MMKMRKEKRERKGEIDTNLRKKEEGKEGKL